MLELLCLDWALSWITCDTVFIVFCIYFILSDAVLPRYKIEPARYNINWVLCDKLMHYVPETLLRPIRVARD